MVCSAASAPTAPEVSSAGTIGLDGVPATPRIASRRRASAAWTSPRTARAALTDAMVQARRPRACAWRRSIATTIELRVPVGRRPHVHAEGARRLLEGDAPASHPAGPKRSSAGSPKPPRPRGGRRPGEPVRRGHRRSARDAARDLSGDRLGARRVGRPPAGGRSSVPCRPASPAGRVDADRDRGRPRRIPAEGGPDRVPGRPRGTRCSTWAPTPTAPVDYPAFCAAAARAVVAGDADRAIVLGGSGQGEQIAANKVHGIRAALCHDLYLARLSREHNDANVLAMGARVVAPAYAHEIVSVWLATPFAGGRHVPRHRADRGDRTRGAMNDA